MKFKVLFILFSLVIFTFTAYSGTLKGINMNDTIKIDGETLVLNGMALRKAKIFFKVYVAGLYLPKKEKNEKTILANDTKWKVVMQFMRSVTADQLNDAWIEGLEDNTPKFSQDLKKQFDLLCSYMEKVKDGDKIEFTYIPNKGTEITVKNKLKGTIPGKAFSNALLSVWIGPDPGPGSGFKEDLLGQ